MKTDKVYIIEEEGGKDMQTFQNTEYLKGLNKEQLEAVTNTEGPMLVLAGAGTGKTKTLVSRVCHMIHNGIEPRQIMLLTFTNAAAREMAARAASMGAKGILATTFHSFCRMFLTVYGKYIGFSKFTVIDQADSKSIMGMMRDQHKTEGKDFPMAKSIYKVYEYAVNNMVSYSKAAGLFLPEYKEEAVFIIRNFMEYKKSRNLMDFEDLLYYMVMLLEKNETIRKNTDTFYRYIMCDEYQDTNVIQNHLLDLMARDYDNLCVVGDDNQSIYAFRGANIGNILKFSDRHPGCRCVKLVENYRSSQQILDVSNAVMRFAVQGIKKDLHGQVSGKRPLLINTNDEYQLAEYLLQRIVSLHNQMPLRKMCVMVRNSMQTMILESVLNKNGIPYEKHGGLKFFEREIVKNIFAFLRVSVLATDEIAWFRLLMLFQGIGKVGGAAIAAQATQGDYSRCPGKLMEILSALKEKGPEEQIRYLLSGVYEQIISEQIKNSKSAANSKEEKLQKLERDIKDAEQLLVLAKEYRRTEDFLSDTVLEPSVPEKEGDNLQISTIHSAKGLEYEAVFLLAPLQGIFPKTQDGDREDPEELRCLYVALTRAKKILEVILPKQIINKGIPVPAFLSHHLDHPEVLSAFDQIDLS